MRAGILGANGYIGKHLTRYLHEKGWEVTGYGRAEAPVFPGLRYTALDVREASEFEKLDTDVDLIFYFAGMTGTVRGYDEYETYIDVNEKGLLHLLNRLRQRNRSVRVIYPSTRLIYKGVTDMPLQEEAAKEFKTLYALNKWFGECTLQQYAAYFNIPFTIFRICVPYANLFEGAYSYGTVGFFLSRATGGQPIGLYGDGSQKRTFTHVEDICAQIYQAVQHPQSLNNTFNIAGETYSLKEVVDAIGRKFSVLTELRPWPEMDEKLESGDTIFDPARIRPLIDQPLKHSFSSWLESFR